MVPVCDHIYNRFRHFWAEIKKLWNYPLQRPYIVCILCCVFQATESHPGSQRDFALRRLQLGESLYYKTLENIVNTEKALRESSVAVRTHSLFSLIKVYHNKVSFLQNKIDLV